MTFPVTLRALHERTPTASEDLAMRRIRDALGEFARHVTRVAVRLEPAVRGSRKGEATCSVEVAVGTGASIVAEEHGRGALEAIDRATDAVVSLLREQFGETKGRPASAKKSGAKAGARVAAVARPKAAAAPRNEKGSDAGLSYALEDSATGKASRKSTRGSSNRAKPDSNLRRREMRRVRAPKTRAMKSKARGERATK